MGEESSRLRCTHCQHENAGDAHFCANCGRPLEEDTTVSLNPLEVPGELSDELVTLREGLTQGEALIFVKYGPNAGTRFTIVPGDETVTLGRDPASDVFLDDVTVSRRHAEVRRTSDGLYLFDLESLNGTYLNRDRVDQTKLASGDEIQIGRFKLVILMGD
jgi:pSer/pThr/pTyr-binding forkhead associated (FHA) protein